MNLLSQICEKKQRGLELLSVAPISAELQASREESFIRAYIPIDQAVHTSKIAIQGRNITPSAQKISQENAKHFSKNLQKVGGYSSTNRISPVGHLHGPSDPFQKGWTNQKVAITPSTLALFTNVCL